MHWLYVFIFFLYLSISDAGQRKTSETWYPLEFSDTIKESENFTNKAVDVSGIFLQKDTSTTSLSGALIVREPLGQDGRLEVIIKVYKVGMRGHEIFFILSANICDHMNDKYAPWAPVFDAMGTHSCPIPADTYEINNMKLDLDYAKQRMKHEYIGEYLASIELMMQKPVKGLLKLGAPKEAISCHIMMVSVIESKEDQHRE